MRTGAEHINVILIHIDRQLAVCLDSICMEQDAVFMGDLADLLNRLDRSDLIVCKHN